MRVTIAQSLVTCSLFIVQLALWPGPDLPLAVMASWLVKVGDESITDCRLLCFFASRELRRIIGERLFRHYPQLGVQSVGLLKREGAVADGDPAECLFFIDISSRV